MTEAELFALAERALGHAGGEVQATALFERRLLPGSVQERGRGPARVRARRAASGARPPRSSTTRASPRSPARPRRRSPRRRSRAIPGLPGPATGRGHDGWDPAVARLLARPRSSPRRGGGRADRDRLQRRGARHRRPLVGAARRAGRRARRRSRRGGRLRAAADGGPEAPPAGAVRAVLAPGRGGGAARGARADRVQRSRARPRREPAGRPARHPRRGLGDQPLRLAALRRDAAAQLRRRGRPRPAGPADPGRRGPPGRARHGLSRAGRWRRGLDRPRAAARAATRSARRPATSCWSAAAPQDEAELLAPVRTGVYVAAFDGLGALDGGGATVSGLARGVTVRDGGAEPAPSPAPASPARRWRCSRARRRSRCARRSPSPGTVCPAIRVSALQLG